MIASARNEAWQQPEQWGAAQNCEKDFQDQHNESLRQMQTEELVLLVGKKRDDPEDTQITQYSKD